MSEIRDITHRGDTFNESIQSFEIVWGDSKSVNGFYLKLYVSVKSDALTTLPPINTWFKSISITFGEGCGFSEYNVKPFVWTDKSIRLHKLEKTIPSSIDYCSSSEIYPDPDLPLTITEDRSFCVYVSISGPWNDEPFPSSLVFSLTFDFEIQPVDGIDFVCERLYEDSVKDEYNDYTEKYLRAGSHKGIPEKILTHGKARCVEGTVYTVENGEIKIISYNPSAGLWRKQHIGPFEMGGALFIDPIGVGSNFSNS